MKKSIFTVTLLAELGVATARTFQGERSTDSHDELAPNDTAILNVIYSRVTHTQVSETSRMGKPKT